MHDGPIHQELTTPAGSHVFVLRVWREGASKSFRASILDSQSSRRRSFASLDDVMEHLFKTLAIR